MRRDQTSRPIQNTQPERCAESPNNVSCGRVYFIQVMVKFVDEISHCLYLFCIVRLSCWWRTAYHFALILLLWLLMVSNHPLSTPFHHSGLILVWSIVVFAVKSCPQHCVVHRSRASCAQMSPRGTLVKGWISQRYVFWTIPHDCASSQKSTLTSPPPKQTRCPRIYARTVKNKRL